MRTFEYLADGHHVDDAGSLISCTYVDFRDPAERSPITTLRKASSKRHAIPGLRHDPDLEAELLRRSRRLRG